MFDLPNTPVNTTLVVAATGVLVITGYFVKKSSNDRQHLVDAQLEMKKIDAEQQANTLNIFKEMNTNKNLV